MDFGRLATFCARLEATQGRLEMTRILAEALAETEPAEMRPLILLLQGKVAPDWEGVELGLAEKMILQVIARAAGMDPQRQRKTVTDAYHRIGDLGQTAEELLAGRAGPRQVGLGSFAPRPEAAETRDLPLIEVHARLLSIAAHSGQGSQQDKQQVLLKLLADVEPASAKYIVRIVAGRLRLGVADMTALDALAAWHLGRGVRSVTEMEPEERAAQERLRASLERAFDLRSDLGLVAETLARGGPEAVADLGMQPGVPLRPMAAERLKTLPEVFEKQAVAVDDGARPAEGTERSTEGTDGSTEGTEDGAGHRTGTAEHAAGGTGTPVPADAGGTTARRAVGMDYKYDGLRVQVHVHDKAVRIYSRRLEDLTPQFPDVVAAFREAFGGRTLIVEGEAVALDASGRMRPFQDISRRRGRKEGLGRDVTTLSGDTGRAGYDITKEIPVTVFVFDVLLADDEETLGLPFSSRRARLETLLQDAGRADHVPAAIRPATYREAFDVADMEAFFQEAVAAGAEGIMCKQPDAPYKAGSRGFAWIKFKTDYTEELVDTMDLVAIGAFYGRGRRAGWYGGLLCAAYDPERQVFASVCKLGTGFDDATLMGLKERFAPHVVQERPAEVESAMVPDVWFAPRVVLEVQAAELTLSPTHRAGWAAIREGAGLAARFPRFTHWRADKAPEQATTVAELVEMYEAQG